MTTPRYTYRCGYGCSQCPHPLNCSICGQNVPRLHATGYRNADAIIAAVAAQSGKRSRRTAR